MVKEALDHGVGDEAKRVLQHVDGRLVPNVVHDNFENATGWDFSTLNVIIHHVEYQLPFKAAFDFVESSLQCLQGHLRNTKLTIAVCLIVDQ